VLSFIFIKQSKTTFNPMLIINIINSIKMLCDIVFGRKKKMKIMHTSCFGSSIISSIDPKSRKLQRKPTAKCRDAKKCVILVPCNSPIENKTDESLRILESRGYEVWRTPGWSAIDQCRNRMAYDAVYRRKFQEVLWIDSDIFFHPDDVERIRGWNEDIVAAAYPMKGWPQMTVQPLPGDKVEFKKSGVLQEVMCVATGFLFTKSKVFRDIQCKLNLPECNTSFSDPQIPFFQPNVWELDGEKYYLGEDFSFCIRARQCGFPIWLDTGIKIGHIGKYTYEWEDVINKTGLNPKHNGDSNLIYNPIK
jgi:hypothetical protein